MEVGQLQLSSCPGKELHGQSYPEDTHAFTHFPFFDHHHKQVRAWGACENRAVAYRIKVAWHKAATQ